MHSRGLGIARLSHRTSNKYSSIVELGETYHYINNEFLNFSKAFEFYRNVDEDDNNKNYSLIGIGLLYEHGDDIETNHEMAFDFYRQSAEKQDKGAYYNLGLLYYYVKRARRNYCIALKWFNLVIEENSEKENMYVFAQVENNSEFDLLTGNNKSTQWYLKVLSTEKRTVILVLCINRGKVLTKIMKLR